MTTWHPAALELLSGYRLTVTELGSALETNEYSIDEVSLRMWLKAMAEAGEVCKTTEHPPRYFKNNTPGEAA